MLDKSTLETFFLGADCHVEQASLDAAGLACPVVNLVEDAVEEPWN